MVWYGSDSGTSSWPPNTSGPRFYIGQLGYGGGATTGYFLTSMAQAAVNSGGFVQGYWFLTEKPTTYSGTDTEWGQHMAQLAIAENNKYSYTGAVIWADVESGSWSTNTASNYNVVKGFCSELQANSYTPGIYSSPSQWTTVCGSNSAHAIAPGYCWTSEPQESSPPTSMSGAATFGGYSSSEVVLWQYVASKTVDYDVYVN